MPSRSLAAVGPFLREPWPIRRRTNRTVGSATVRRRPVRGFRCNESIIGNYLDSKRTGRPERNDGRPGLRALFPQQPKPLLWELHRKSHKGTEFIIQPEDTDATPKRPMRLRRRRSDSEVAAATRGKTDARPSAGAGGAAGLAAAADSGPTTRSLPGAYACNPVPFPFLRPLSPLHTHLSSL